MGQKRGHCSLSQRTGVSAETSGLLCGIFDVSDHSFHLVAVNREVKYLPDYALCDAYLHTLVFDLGYPEAHMHFSTRFYGETLKIAWSSVEERKTTHLCALQSFGQT